MKHPRAGYVLLLLAIGALVSACATGTSATPVASTDAPSRDTRSDCRQILGTPFRSNEERTWFEANCSKWAVSDVPAAASVQLPPECAAMRGKPYTSADQRQWFLANCNVGAGTPQPTGTARASGTPATSAFNTPGSAFNTPGQASDPNVPATSGPDRTDCNSIRGTAYRSTAERNWFAANCPSSGAAQPNATPTPNEGTNSRNRQSTGLPQSSASDRTDCYAISGTPYRSANEETWYLANCFPPRR